MINVEEEILQLKVRIATLEQLLNQSPASGRPSTEAKKLSIREFMLSKPVKDSTQAALVAAYYLEKYSEYASFNTADLLSAFQLAKETPPGNIADRVNSLIRQGLVMKAKDKKDNKVAWTLTNSGEKAVEECAPKGK